MLTSLKKNFASKKVFITGHTGFKGSWLTKILSMAGAKVKGYSLAPLYPDDTFTLLGIEHMVDSIIGDIRDHVRLASEIKGFEPDFIFHLAAQPLVRESYSNPLGTLEVNVTGTANVLEAVKGLKKKCTLIMITTDKVYHNNEWAYPYRENDRLGGYDIYSSSKACAELVIDSYRNSFFNLANFSSHEKAIAVARAGNVIGGGDQSADRLVPDIVRYLARNKVIILRNPGAIRPWQHVIEPLAGYLKLAEMLAQTPEKYSQAYNFGPISTDNTTVEELVSTAIRKWGSGSYKVEKKDTDSHEAGILKLDISKARAELGWRPRMNVGQALDLTLDWYKMALSAPEKINELTEQQITNFFDEKESIANER